MTALPPSSDLVNTGITKGTFKAALSNLRAYLSGILGDSGTQATALTALGALLNGSVDKSAAYTVVAADRGKLVDCTGAGGWTLAVDAVGSLGTGFAFAVSNRSSGNITIDPNLSEQIDGATTLVLEPGDSCAVLCNGTALVTVGRTSRPNGALRSVQVFTTVGANTYTKPVGLKRLRVTVVGGGGGSGAASGTSSLPAASGAAGGGGVAFDKLIEAGDLGATETVTVGAGGAGGTGSYAAPGNGAAGGSSSFGSHVSATGGTASLGAYRVATASGVNGNGSGGLINWKGSVVGQSVEGFDVAGNATKIGCGGTSRFSTTDTLQYGYSGFRGIVIIEEFY